MIERAPTLDDLRAHRLQLYAAAAWRKAGRPVPAELAEDELFASIRVLGVLSLLERIRDACDGPILLIKGYEVAVRYPDPALRPFGDVDLLVPEPENVSHALRSKGFEPVGYPDDHYDSLHHLRPLRLPSLPITIEIHRRPEWVRWSAAPPTEQLLAHAAPSRSGVDGILAPSPAQHALIVTAHSWSDLPLRRIADLIDARALAAEALPGEVDEWAERWDLDGLWRFTERLRSAVLDDGPPPLGMRIWGRSALATRDATVLEQHERRLLAPFSVLSVRRAFREAAAQAVAELTPAGGETWRAKLARTALAVRHAFVRRSQHDARWNRHDGER